MALYVVYLSHRQALLAAAENFTVLIKNSITYPKFKVNRSVFLIRYRLLTRTYCFIVCHNINHMSSFLPQKKHTSTY